MRRLCSKEETYEKRCKELTKRLLKRGNPARLLPTALTRASSVPCEKALGYKPKPQSSERVHFVITHNPTHPPLALWLRET
ncbi:hypothetical protein ACOMHN_053100 [Nucella lapillus]